MEEIKVRNKHYTAIAWGLLFLLLGTLMIIPGDQNAIFVLGIGIVLLGLNLVRSIKKIPVSPFSTTLGILALGFGSYAMVRPLLQLPHIQVDLIPVVLIVIGLYVLIPSPKYPEDQHSG